MSIDIITGFFSSSREALDKRSGPYETTTEANAALGPFDRYVGLSVLIIANASKDGGGNYITGDVAHYIYDGGIADNNLVEDSSGGTGTYTSSIAAGTLVPDTVGGYLAGTDLDTFNGDGFSAMWDTLLFPTIAAYISDTVDVVLSGQSSTSLEQGVSTSVSITATFDSGDITNGDGSAGPDVVGAANNYTFTLPDTSTVDQGLTTLYTDGAYVVELGGNTWGVAVTHDIGTGAYYDSTGAAATNLDGSRGASSTSDNSGTITGYTPYLIASDASDVSGGGTALYGATDSKLITGKSNKTVSLTASNEYVYFTYPETYGTLTTIVDNNGFDVTGSWTLFPGVPVTSTGLATDWTVDCNIYRTTSPTTIGGVNYQFKY
tara:strand:+ start:41077 stop:42207 length:1131 start_codon:yes stop_codon:yes gene_type:complete